MKRELDSKLMVNNDALNAENDNLYVSVNIEHSRITH